MNSGKFLALCLVLLFGSPLPATTPKANRDKIVHALNRLSFGPRLSDVQAVEKLSLDRWIEQQLHPEKIQESELLSARLQPLESISLSTSELTRAYPPPAFIRQVANGKRSLPSDPQTKALVETLAEKYRERMQQKQDAPETTNRTDQPGKKKVMAMSPEDRRQALLQNAPVRVVAQDLQDAKLLRAIYSNRQLAEVLSDFWFNHFNVFLDKGADRYFVTSYERDAIRPNVLGNFRQLLEATASHPAMLWYLDNWQSAGVEAAAGRMRLNAKRKVGLNENYARELLELHTLGVDGGYTQKDIIEVARCFTGWSIDQPYANGEFIFREKLHDRGEKVVLGVTISAGGGKEDGLKVLDILAHHPSTAKHISRKLAQRFVADDPPETLVASMARTFTKTRGDIRQVMKTMLDSKEFWSQSAVHSKVKSPFEFVVSAVRAANADVTSGLPLAQKLAELGQPLYRKQEPTGYSNLGEEWVNSAALLARMNFALAFAEGRLPGIKIEQPFAADQLAAGLLFREPTDQTKTAVERGRQEGRSPAVIAGLVLGSPDFQRK